MLSCVIQVYRVENHTCVPCDRGKYNPHNNDSSGEDTYCIPCETGKYQDLEGQSSCKSVICDENEYVSGNQCVACPPGTYNAPGDDASETEYNNLCRASNSNICTGGWWHSTMPHNNDNALHYSKPYLIETVKSSGVVKSSSKYGRYNY